LESSLDNELARTVDGARGTHFREKELDDVFRLEKQWLDGE
jgi:hypothetical protein